jgi:NTE family protein
MTLHRPDIAFVLSGGASLGAVQAGTLRALYERGIRPDLIVGTSAGALNGAFIASRPATIGTAEELGEIWRGLRRSQVFPLNPVTGLLGFLGAHDHLIGECGLRRLIARHTEHELIEELPVPLHVVAVDVVTGEEVLLSDGSLSDAIAASASIPALLPPVRWGERMLMDGGVANSTPISQAVALGARRIYVLPTGHACQLPAPPRGALEMALHALSLLTHRRLIEDIERHRGDAQLVVLPPPCPLRVTPYDFSQADALIERALHDARAFLDGGGERRAPIRMRMHAHPSEGAGERSALLAALAPGGGLLGLVAATATAAALPALAAAAALATPARRAGRVRDRGGA